MKAILKEKTNCIVLIPETVNEFEQMKQISNNKFEKGSTFVPTSVMTIIFKDTFFISKNGDNL